MHPIPLTAHDVHAVETTCLISTILVTKAGCEYSLSGPHFETVIFALPQSSRQAVSLAYPISIMVPSAMRFVVFG